MNQTSTSNKRFDPLKTPCVSLARAARKLGCSVELLEDLAKRGVIQLHPTLSGQFEISTADIEAAENYQLNRRR